MVSFASELEIPCRLANGFIVAKEEKKLRTLFGNLCFGEPLLLVWSLRLITSCKIPSLNRLSDIVIVTVNNSNKL